MKRIVVLLDGTWNDERRSDVTNVAKLDARARPNMGTFIRPRSHDGTEQLVFYHTGVGTEAYPGAISRRCDRARVEGNCAR